MITRGTLIVASLLFARGSAQASVQDTGKTSAAQEAGIAAITLGTTSGSPGDSIVVPLYFTPTEGAAVGSLKLEISYVSANLKFSKLEKGIAAETGGVELKSNVKTAKNEKGIDTQTLQITAALASPESSGKGIPAGLLAFVILQSSENGRSASITLHGSGEAGRAGGTQPPQKLKPFETTVDVLAAGTGPMVTCFFFTH